LTIGINSRKKVVVLGVVWLVAGSLLYIYHSSRTPPRPALKTTRSEERIDRAIADPKLRMDLLARLQSMQVSGARRDLFQFVVTEANMAVKPERKITPDAMTQPSKGLDGEQPALFPFRYYGYTLMVKRPKRGFFLEDDAIYIASEGELIKSRYKVMHVGANSAVVEDTSNKSQRALPLVDSI
jgi:hypothetical protein